MAALIYAPNPGGGLTGANRAPILPASRPLAAGRCYTTPDGAGTPIRRAVNPRRFLTLAPDAAFYYKGQL